MNVARQIGYCASSYKSKFYSRKNGCTIITESSLESDFRTLLEYDHNVKSYLAQPVTIRYIDGGTCRHYTPDFFVEYYDRGKQPKNLLVEVKYSKDLLSNRGLYSSRFEAAEAYATEKGWTFETVDESIRTPYLDNAKFLLRYLRTESSPWVTDCIDHWMEKLQVTTPYELITVASKDEDYQQNLLDGLWRQVSQRYILTDLTRPLGMSSEISVLDLASIINDCDE